ncbi:MAG TPA: Gfo/Idh/MocA family oxidoreductase [Acidobacteriaceae bacterium]|nr:Gfo/Idh/MocA family oxidoreductase [Acidobacteriaceae bacterium]
MPGTIGVLVCGAGAFGRNHLRVYHALENETAREGAPVRLAAIVEPDPARAAAAVQEWRVPVFASASECLAARRRGDVDFQAASVCTPTSTHFEVAQQLLSADLDVLVEKPIATSVSEASKLVELGTVPSKILQIGHLERFNPAVTATEPLINSPMFFEAHRLSVFTPRSLDVDVVLDLMVHDLDIVLSLVRSPVRSLHAVGLPILSRKVDIANVRVEFESGCVANFTASRVSTERVRKLRFFQPHQYVSIDYARQDVLVIDVSGARPNSGAPFKPDVGLSGKVGVDPGAPFKPDVGLSGSSGLRIDKPAVQQGEPLRLEIESFLDCVRTRSAPRVSGEDGRAALALALDINRAIAEHAQRAGLDRFSTG